MNARFFRGYATAAVMIVVTSCAGGDDGRQNTSWGNASSVTHLTTAGASATATEDGSTAPAVPTDGSASDTESAGAGTTSPVGDSSTGGSSTGGSSTSTTGTTTGSATAANTSDSGESDGGTTFAVDSCKQVDFLFVIDDSLSMEGEQAALTAAFPAFLATMKSALPTSDYHIMVVDTDAAGRCSAADCTHKTCQEAEMHACMDIFDACDTTRGAGVVHPAGAFTANKPCGFDPGRRFLLGTDPDVTTKFECAAEVGTAGDPSERPMDAMVEAVSAPLRAPGGCNEGFLRDDAILVVTFITDDENIEDLNTVQQTHDALVAAKGGDADRIVMLGLIPGVGCSAGGLHWAQLISLFGAHGIQGLVCSPDYSGFFQDAVATIVDTCVVNPS